MGSFLPGKKYEDSLNELKALAHQNNSLVCNVLSEPAFQSSRGLGLWGLQTHKMVLRSSG